MSENIMVRVLIISFGLGAVLDFIMAIFGMVVILQLDSAFGYITCVTGAFALLCLRLCMETIRSRKGALYRCIFWALLFAIVLDFYAVTNAVIVHIMAKQPLGTVAKIDLVKLLFDTTFSSIFVCAALVLFLTASPMALSYLIKEQFSEEDE